jgi:hypothetical protein
MDAARPKTSEAKPALAEDAVPEVEAPIQRLPARPLPSKLPPPPVSAPAQRANYASLDREQSKTSENDSSSYRLASLTSESGPDDDRRKSRVVAPPNLDNDTERVAVEWINQIGIARGVEFFKSADENLYERTQDGVALLKIVEVCYRRLVFNAHQSCRPLPISLCQSIAQMPRFRCTRLIISTSALRLFGINWDWRDRWAASLLKVRSRARTDLSHVSDLINGDQKKILILFSALMRRFPLE